MLTLSSSLRGPLADFRSDRRPCTLQVDHRRAEHLRPIGVRAALREGLEKSLNDYRRTLTTLVQPLERSRYGPMVPRFRNTVSSVNFSIWCI
jgi:hypothetical protein